MKLRHLFFACSGVFVMMFSLLLLVVIVFSDEEDGGSGGNLIYGGVSVSQEVLGSIGNVRSRWTSVSISDC